MPNKYLLASTNEFLDIINGSKPRGIMASLDVESLYTNIPVRRTIEIVLKHVYHHNSMIPPKIPMSALKSLLEICTQKAPFKNINGDIYEQSDGLAMGGPLSCTLANYFMCEIENKILEEANNRPHLYARYIDDIFIDISSEEQLIDLKNIFIQESGMNFTHEMSINSKLPFLDVLLNNSNPDKYLRNVYTKPTKSDDCINYDCDAPERYKLGVIKTLLHRAYKICNTQEALDSEVIRIKNLLVNNNFPNRIIDKITTNFKEKNEALNQQIDDQVNPPSPTIREETGTVSMPS